MGLAGYAAQQPNGGQRLEVSEERVSPTATPPCDTKPP